MEALSQFVPSVELAPFYSDTSGGGAITGSYIYYIDGVQVSDELVFSSTSAQDVIVAISASVNTYQTHYVVTFSGLTLTISSSISGTVDNDSVITTSVNGVVTTTGVLMGGSLQWCLTDTQANKILNNIDELCGCPCDCDGDILDDTLPKYIN